MTIGEKIQEVLKGIKVIENKEYNLMTISKEMWDSDYQGEPTIPLSVIEKIHDAIDNADADGFLDDEHGYYIGSMLTKEHVHEIIDKAVKECIHE